jgi:hypothetical protein
LKRLFSLSLLLTAAAALASADTITASCGPDGVTGNTGTITTTCNSAGTPVGATSVDDLILTFRFDANFGIGAGSVQENYVLIDGGALFGGLLDHPLDQIVTDSVRGIQGTFEIFNPTVAQVNAILGGLQITDNWDSGTGSFNSPAFSYQIKVDYSTASASAPEPATLGLMGTALVGLGFLARRRRRS